MLNLFVVPCSHTKSEHPAPARDLYTSHHFRYTLRQVTTEAGLTPNAQIVILSARHGLVRPTDLLAPYDTTINDPASISPRKLADQLGRLAAHHRGPGGHAITETNPVVIEVYAALPQAYLDRLTTAAQLLRDSTSDAVQATVFDVYEACGGIGDHRNVLGHLGKPFPNEPAPITSDDTGRPS